MSHLIVFCYVFTYASHLTSSKLPPLNINELYSYGTNMDAYDDR